MLQGLLGNFRQTLRAITFRSFSPDDLDTSAAQVMLTLGLSFLAILGLHAWASWPVAGIDAYAAMNYAGGWFVFIAITGIAVAVVGASDRLPALLLVQVFVLIIINVITAILCLASLLFSDAAGTAVIWSTALVAGALLLLAVYRTLALVPWRAAAGTAALFALFWIVTDYVPVEQMTWRVFETRADETADADDFPEVDVEQLHTWQEYLREEQWSGLPRGIPGTPEAFALVLGGTSHESVFASEVARISDILAERMDTGTRTLRLLNSDADPLRHPMANRDNLARALHLVADRMDPGEDIAFLYLSSHGGEDVLSLSFWQAQTRSLDAREFAQMLDEAGLTNAVIVLSACYSGSFIDDLAAPDRVIITAAAADRTSFGCADGRDWTYWGQALFDNAVRETRDIREAFGIARTLVTEWETRDGQTPSDPQIDVGQEIGPALDAWLSTFPEHEARVEP